MFKKLIPMIKSIILVAIGGSLGSVLRFLISVLMQKYWNHLFPLATFSVNVIGCFIIGLLIGIFDKNLFSDESLKWLLVTGFCGGFTTFSAFSIESFNLIQQNQIQQAIIYILSSIILGILSVWGGLFASKIF